MLQRILVILLLMTVEFSTVRDGFIDVKSKVEIKDIEDNTESEDSMNEIGVDKFFVSSINFQFVQFNYLLKISVNDEVSAIIPQPHHPIDSPPPKFFFI